MVDEVTVACPCGETVECETGVVTHCDCGRAYDGDGECVHVPDDLLTEAVAEAVAEVAEAEAEAEEGEPCTDIAVPEVPPGAQYAMGDDGEIIVDATEDDKDIVTTLATYKWALPQEFELGKDVEIHVMATCVLVGDEAVEGGGSQRVQKLKVRRTVIVE